MVNPQRVFTSYPHELFRMCQRAMIAVALACKPLLIADEPTTV